MFKLKTKTILTVLMEGKKVKYFNHVISLNGSTGSPSSYLFFTSLWTSSFLV